MIYQHRLIARSGRLEKRNEVFEREMLSALDGHGSVLIGAWEVLMGPDAGSAVYQLRQFDSLAAWEQHQERVRLDRQHKGRQANLYPSLDAVDTAIVRLAERAAADGCHLAVSRCLARFAARLLRSSVFAPAARFRARPSRAVFR
jgi:hypothetical protein